MKKPRIIRPALHLEEHPNVIRDPLLLAQHGSLIVTWSPAIDDIPAKLMFVNGASKRVVRTGGRPGAAMRECKQEIADFLNVPLVDVEEHLGLGRTVIWG